LQISILKMRLGQIYSKSIKRGSINMGESLQVTLPTRLKAQLPSLLIMLQ